MTTTTTVERFGFAVVFCADCLDTVESVLLDADTAAEREVCGECNAEADRLWDSEVEFAEAVAHDAAEAAWEARREEF